MVPGLVITNGVDLSSQDQPQPQSDGPSPAPLLQPVGDLDNGDQTYSNGHTETNTQEASSANGFAHNGEPSPVNVVEASGNGVLNGNGAHIHEPLREPTNQTNGNGSHTPEEGSTPLNGFDTPASSDLPAQEKVETNAAMRIAVIGIAVRAGSASTPDEFFEMLSRGRSSWSPEIPPERFNNASFYHPNAGKLGCINTNGACFIQQDITKFDAPFFSITELEATSMDPQQRLLLECAFETLDNAGIQKHTTVGKDIGVFIGAGSPEYEFDLFRDSDTMPMFQATGNHLAMQSNRISHFFDWRGPSVTMDTACSSSLTAVHFACQSIRNRESKVALVGGCNLNIIPEYFINYSTSRLLGNDGKSFSFDARGTGYGRGEGCGMLLLKPLDQAIKDNDCIRAVIAASGVNQDGHTPGITMPNGESQETLVRAVYENAGLDPSLTGYVEAHGTGTRVGDPIEVTALHNVFNEGRTPRNPLYLGSVKSNIGHLESASGILAVIKTAVMLDRGFILPNYDFKVGNPKIPFAEWGLKVPTRQVPWPRSKRFASINNFGFGGTNAHVVMERAPLKINNDVNNPNVKEEPTEKLFVLSAADKVACQTLMSNLGVYLEQRPEMFQRDLMSNIAYTLGQRRSLLPWRVAVPATDSFSLVEKISKGTINPVRESGAPRIGFVCTGQGAQWWAMGRELYERYPIFAEVMDQADAILTQLGAPYSLLEELSLDEKTTRVNQANISQPSCTAIQLALIELLRSWGVVPTAVVGHSSGEIAAAFAAGILSIQSAMEIAYHRGRLVPVLKERYPELQGTMMAIGCAREEVEPLIHNLRQGKARIACYNSPDSLTISGDTPAIVELSEILEEKQIFNRRLVIETAYHSHHMEMVADDYLDSLQHLPAPAPANARFFSSLTGKEASHEELDSQYWVSNLTSPVKFAQACAHLVAPSETFTTGVDLIIEIGPHSALQGPVKQILKKVGGPAEKIPYLASLVRKKDAVGSMLALASTLFCRGSLLEMDKINFPKLAKKPTLLVDLPRYPWNHSKSYWHESRIARVHKRREYPRHDILGTMANYANELEPTWRNVIRLDDIPWLRHHKIQSLTIFPISGFVGMVIEAAHQEARSKNISVGHIELRDIVVHKPLMISDESIELTITLRSQQAGELSPTSTTRDFLIHSYSESKGWTENCTGSVTLRTPEVNEVDGQRLLDHNAARRADLASEIQHVSSSVSSTKIYEALEELGVSYGPTFQGLTDCLAGEKQAVANITVTDTAAEMPDHFETKHIVHPSFLEQLIQMYWPLLGAGREPLDVICLPSSIHRLTVSLKVLEHASAPGQSLRAYCTASDPISSQVPSKVSMFAVADGETIIAIDDLTVAPLPKSDDEVGEQLARELCYKQVWEPILEPLEKTEDTRVDSPQIAALEDGNAQQTETVAIIHGNSAPQLEFARMLAASIESLGNMKVDMAQLEEIDPTEKHCICITELDQPILSTLNQEQFLALRNIVQNAQDLLWVTRGAYGQKGDPTTNMVSGFSRAIRSETMFKFATLDLDAEERLDDSLSARAIVKIFNVVASASSIANTEVEFQERKGEFRTPRIVLDDDLNEHVHKKTYPPAVENSGFGGRSLKIALKTPGNFDSLYFTDDGLREQSLAADQIEIEVKAVALNSRDIYSAMGLVDSGLGQECSGIVSRVGSDVKSIAVGDRVAALAGSAFATYARANADFTIKIGQKVSFEEAANLALAHCSAYYGLIDLARVEDEDAVLILNGAGTVGQAAISLAQTMGSTVFTTVDTAEEKQILMQDLDLPEDHIFYSKDDQLTASILQATANRGVDVVLSIQAHETTTQSALECISSFGRFVQEETADASRKLRLDLSSLKGNISFFSFDLHALATQKPRVLRRLIKEVSRSLSYGKIGPIKGSRIMPISEVSEAFKLARSAPATSRIVVVPHPEDIVRVTPSNKLSQLFKEDATYILIGGTGGLGRGMTRWMASRGAKNLVLLSRSGNASGEVQTLIDDLALQGVKVIVHSCDVAKKEDVETLLTEKLTELPPIRGVIHGAMILRDTLFEKMELKDWTEVIESKVQGAWNFHNALASVPLDFFILYSSSAAAMGGRGQGAYAAANSFLDAFAQYRRSLGLPGASLGPTAVIDAGFLFENGEMMKDVIRNIGDNYITQAEVLSLLESTLNGTADKSCDSHIITGVHLDPLNLPFWATDAKYKHLRIAAEAAAAQLNNGTKAVSWSAAFKAAQSLSDAEQVVCDGLVEKIAKTLSMEVEEVDPTRNLSNYSLDSLTAIDVRNFITREFESTMQVLELLASGTIQTLAKAVCAKSKLLKVSA